MRNESNEAARGSQALVVRALIGGEEARLLAVEARELVAHLKALHRLSGTATAALGRLSRASLLMADDMKKSRRARVTLSVDGDGPLGKIVADAESEGFMRGFVANPSAEPEPKGPGKWNVAAGVGSGTLSVIKDLGLKEPVRGRVPLRSGEIAEDVAAYYVRSEQTRTALALGVLEHEGVVVAAGGLMVQLFPDTTETFADEVERRFSSLPQLSGLFLEEGGNVMRVVERFASGLDLYWLGRQEYRFGCRCDRDVASSGLMAALGGESVDESQEVRCHFCNTSYLFSPAEIAELQRRRRS